MRGKTGKLDEQRKRYQRAAAKHFLKALEKQQVDADQRGAVAYLVAELLRRTGRHSAALKQYDQASKEQPSPTWLRELIAEQRALAVNGTRTTTSELTPLARPAAAASRSPHQG